MSWLSRLFSSSPPPAPVNSVVIPDDIAAELTAPEHPLDETVNAILRAHVDALKNPAKDPKELLGLPFWLKRDSTTDQADDELRDRVTTRRSAENDR